MGKYKITVCTLNILSLLLGRVSRESITLLFGYLWYEINMIWNTIFKDLIVSFLFKIFGPNTITELS